MSYAEEFSRWFQYRKKRYRICFRRRPFREGLEAHFEINGEVVTLAELGLGEKALIAKAKSIIDVKLGER